MVSVAKAIETSIYFCSSKKCFPVHVRRRVYSLSLSLPLPYISLSDDAFLLSEPHVTAMFQCLEAVEQNNPKLLAQVDTVGVGFLHFPVYVTAPVHGQNKGNGNVRGG